ncbi:MAG: Holliday junction resolvase RuvX [Prolixibacteraceae bacterium]|nr:Holliday junction resolvase RuvX [Prolixibacteraceae bacterium]
MGRIMAIDYGKKRVGLSVTDTLQLIATRLETVEADLVWKFLDDYFAREEVDLVLVGYPVQLNNQPSEALRFINPFVQKFRKKYEKDIRLVDERFSSKMAFQSMIDAGLRKSQRQDKGTIDGVSATILLQSYLEQKKYI